GRTWSSCALVSGGGAPWPARGHGDPVVGQDEIVSRPEVKRPAWLFSARASVSSHSAISSKPSSRAVFAKPGYISVYSYVSPAIADFRLSAVGPTFTPVTGSPTSARKSKWPNAWPVSPSATERNSAAMSGYPSTSAFCAKYRYRRLAWLSPANAVLRFSWVLVPLSSGISFLSMGLGGWTACGADPAEDHFGGRDVEPMPLAGRDPQSRRVGVHVDHPPAPLADKVMVGVDVRVEARRAGTEVELQDLAHVGEIVEGLVHGAQRDRRHHLGHGVVHRLRGRVGVRIMEDGEDRLALRCDLQPSDSEQLGELGGRLHGGHPSDASSNSQLLLIGNECVQDRGGCRALAWQR